MKTVLKILFQIFFGVGLAIILFFSFFFLEGKLQQLVIKPCFQRYDRSDIVACPAMFLRSKPKLAVFTFQLFSGEGENCTCGRPFYIHVDIFLVFFLVYILGVRAVMKRFRQ